MVRPGEDRRPPAACLPTVHLERRYPGKSLTPSSSPQVHAPASRPWGRTALCARRSGIHRNGSALSPRAAGSGTSPPHHPVQRETLCRGGGARGSRREQQSAAGVIAINVARRVPKWRQQDEEPSCHQQRLWPKEKKTTAEAAQPSGVGAAGGSPTPASGERRATPQPWP